MASDLGPIGPLLGDNSCVHTLVRYYRSGYNAVDPDPVTGEGYSDGTYGVCDECSAHFWMARPPEGAEVINLDAPYDDGEAQQ